MLVLSFNHSFFDIYLAQIEARPKSAHRYNVAEQQQIYKEEV